MPTYKPNRMNTCCGFFAGGDGEAGFEYFHERDGERTVLIFATEYIQLPSTMRVLNENKQNWVKAGAGLPVITPRENIVLMPELDIVNDGLSLTGVMISEKIKEADKRRYLRQITSTKHKRDLWVPDEHAKLLQAAMDENKDLELFADNGKVAGFYLIGESEKIYAYLPEWKPEQTEIPLGDLPIPETPKMGFAKPEADDDEL